MPLTLFHCALLLSLAVFSVGIVWRICSWFRTRVGLDATGVPTGARAASTVRGLAARLFSRRLPGFCRILFLEVGLQTRLIREDFFRWLTHVSIFCGFVLLLLMHALDEWITQPLIQNYASTLNPFLFLRDLFGAFLLVGLLGAVARRLRAQTFSLTSVAGDWLAIGLLVLIALSGILLAGAKILSASIFDKMVADYAPMLEAEDVPALRGYWSAEYAVVFPAGVDLAGPDALERGRELHEDSCSSCHSTPGTAFLSYGAALLLKPWAVWLDQNRVHILLWQVHFLTCFLGLAYLPFSKMFHVISSPISLLAAGAARPAADGRDRAGAVTRRALALDACIRCGICSRHCSVRPLFTTIPNKRILPSEKLLAVAAWARRKDRGIAALVTLSEGSHLCTLCLRCTQVCPVGIDLQDLWFSSRAELASCGFPDPHVWIREKDTATWAERVNPLPVPSPGEEGGLAHISLAAYADRLLACVQCQMCTNVCPVVACAENTGKDVDLTPQQIMNLLRLGLKEMTLGSTMVWNCVTCYQCQEHCPEGIPVADILYDLRNLAYQHFRAYRLTEGLPTRVPEECEESSDSGVRRP